MLHAIEPAPLADILRLAAPAGYLKPLQSRVLFLQAVMGATVAFADERGTVLVVIGMVPLPAERPGEELTELWFLCRPDIAPRLPGLVRLARLTLRRSAHGGVVRVRSFVRVGHAPGERLARLIGLLPAGRDGAFGRWEWTGGPE